MELLVALEEKIKMLALHAKSLKEQLHVLQSAYDMLVVENKELKTENGTLIESNAQFTHQLKALENSILLESGNVSELKEERLVTRSVLDDLIKSIDSIVENEN